MVPFGGPVKKANTKQHAKFHGLDRNTSPSPPVSRTNWALDGGASRCVRGVKMSPGARSGVAPRFVIFYENVWSRWHRPGKPRRPPRASLAHPPSIGPQRIDLDSFKSYSLPRQRRLGADPG